ncbi:ERV/ALR sulfhydryl oxidase domain-containing protein [Kockovaella imperatae]|uniref:Sulfhydryl oxidase n=1 Tax=Kockovaella imperatae TaxID=4999 RepID=A0A1Y1URC1_9TREE|nr:ERV/ALR sulfhydryl oxidase domain-containing protein [Kockovaella imperatae]ORX40034.1 ERV/ALR sulfhydryl oxidase domain-containing protein [Kockovaella imperatae]
MDFGDQAGPSRITEPLRTTKETHPNLPPGLILGPDGKPCKVCNSWQDWAKLKVKKKGETVESHGTAAIMGGGKVASRSSGKPSRKDCPADTEALGRSTWTFLHTTAAYYPVSAPTSTQTQMRNLLSSLSLLYPCVPCAEDFQEKVKENPPDVSGREGLSRWLCERHNEVNEKLGKESFDCAWKSLNERWKDGPEDGRCD